MAKDSKSSKKKKVTIDPDADQAGPSSSGRTLPDDMEVARNNVLCGPTLNHHVRN